MTKKEKTAAFLMIFSMFLLITSAIFTVYQNKPENYQFRIEKVLKTYF